MWNNLTGAPVAGRLAESGIKLELAPLVVSTWGEWKKRHPETLVLVTADHSHAAQIVSETGELMTLNFASPGYFARVRTPEGGVMGINYATNDSPIREYHTGSQIPVFGSGLGVGELPRFMRQAAIFAVMARHLGLVD